MREFNSALQQFRQEQAQRKEHEKQELEQAIDLFKLHKMLDQPFHPQEFGFVLTVAEIEQKARLAERIQAAAIARNVGFNKQKFLQATAQSSADSQPYAN